MKRILLFCLTLNLFNIGLYAQSKNFKTSVFCDSLNTIYNHTYQNHGAMFNVVAKDSILLKQLSANLATGSFKYYIYYKQGSFIGFETNPTAWTIIDSAIVQSTNNGSTIADQPTVIPINLGLAMTTNDTIALYLTSPVVSRVYLKSTATPWGTTYVTDSSMSISVARSVYQRFGVPFSTPQIWNGTVSYCKLSPTVIVKNSPIKALPFTAYVFEKKLYVNLVDNLQSDNHFIKVTDLLNRELIKTPIYSNANTMDVSNLPMGVYFCSLLVGDKLLGSLKLIVN